MFSDVTPYNLLYIFNNTLLNFFFKLPTCNPKDKTNGHQEATLCINLQTSKKGLMKSSLN